MFTINKSQVHYVAGQELMLVEASEIGLAPGQWPDVIAIADDVGDGFVFVKSRQIQGGGWRYESRTSSAALEVLND